MARHSALSLGAAAEFSSRHAVVRTFAALAVLDDPGVSLDIFEGDALLWVKDE